MIWSLYVCMFSILRAVIYAHWMHYVVRMMLCPSPGNFPEERVLPTENIPMILPEPQEGPHQSHLSNQIKAGFVKTLRYPGCRQLAECELVDDYREDRLLQARSRWLSGAVQSATGCHCPVRHRSKRTRQNRCSNAANLAPSKRWLGVLSKIERFESQGNLPSLLSHIVFIV